MYSLLAHSDFIPILILTIINIIGLGILLIVYKVGKGIASTILITLLSIPGIIFNLQINMNTQNNAVNHIFHAIPILNIIIIILHIKKIIKIKHETSKSTD